MRPLKWALIQYNWCPYQRLGHRHVKAKERPYEATVTGGHLEARKRALRRNQPYWQPDLGLLPSRTVWKTMCLVYAPQSKALLWQPQQTLHGGWPLCCRMFSISLALFPVMPVAIPQPDSFDSQNVSTQCQMSPEGQTLPPLFQMASGHLCFALTLHGDCY